MFSRRPFKSSDRVEKSVKNKGKLYADPAKVSKLQQSFEKSAPSPRALLSPLVTLRIGPDRRLFAAHYDVLSRSPFMAAALRMAHNDARGTKTLDLPNEDPEIFACILEYLYKGDYSPRLVYNERKARYDFEVTPLSPNENRDGRARRESTMYIPALNEHILRDTVIYCLASRLGLDELKALALRKQGMQSCIECGIVLRSARYAYDNTPDSDAQLRAHYLAMIIRCRKTFKRSGTMQKEMEIGGKLFFDLFVALCNHVDDISEFGSAIGSPTPRGTPKTPQSLF